MISNLKTILKENNFNFEEIIKDVLVIKNFISQDELKIIFSIHKKNAISIASSFKCHIWKSIYKKY